MNVLALPHRQKRAGGRRPQGVPHRPARTRPCPTRPTRTPAPRKGPRPTARPCGVHRALHRLPDPYREVFWLRVYGELNFADIARLFEKTESWARVTYYRAKIKLREELT